MSDEMDLLVEQIKMLAGEIAFGTSTLKRLMEQSVNDPDGTRIQVQFLFLKLTSFQLENTKLPLLHSNTVFFIILLHLLSWL